MISACLKELVAMPIIVMLSIQMYIASRGIATATIVTAIQIYGM